MAELDTVTIGLTLLGFILGAVIVALANQSRMKRLEEAHGAQLRRMRDEETKRIAALEDAHAAIERVESEKREAQRETQSAQQEIDILRAQQSEEVEAAMGLEDRLNAAEARLLTLDAASIEQEEELLRWNRAYGTLKVAHTQLVNEHNSATSRGLQLEDDLARRQQEVDALHGRLDALQNALSLAMQSGGNGALLALPGSEIPEGVEAIALAKAEVQTLLRERETELRELRSRLSLARFSVNVLAHSGAELAALLNQNEEERNADALEAAVMRFGQSPLRDIGQDAGAESLASLEGIIGDWFREVKPMLPWSSAMLGSFAGESIEARFGKLASPAQDEDDGDLDESEWTIGEWEAGDEPSVALGGVEVISFQETLPPELMLATVKAATTSALQRTIKRQYQLESDALRAQEELAKAQAGAEAWRTLVAQIAAQDADVAALMPAEGEGELPESDAVIALLRAKLEATGRGTATDLAAIAADPATAAMERNSAPATQDRGAARRTLTGWLRRIDQAVQRQPRTNE